MPLNAFLGVKSPAEVPASDSGDRGVSLRSFAEEAGSLKASRGFRRTHAGVLLRQGERPRVARESLGHANVGITLDRYSHVFPHMQSDSAAKIDAGMRKAFAR